MRPTCRAGLWPQLFSSCVAEGCAGGRASWEQLWATTPCCGQGTVQQGNAGHAELAFGSGRSLWMGSRAGHKPRQRQAAPFQDVLQSCQVGSGLKYSREWPLPARSRAWVWWKRSPLAVPTSPSGWVRAGVGQSAGRGERSGASCHQHVRRVNGRCGCGSVLYF